MHRKRTKSVKPEQSETRSGLLKMAAAKASPRGEGVPAMEIDSDERPISLYVLPGQSAHSTMNPVPRAEHDPSERQSGTEFVRGTVDVLVVGANGHLIQPQIEFEIDEFSRAIVNVKLARLLGSPIRQRRRVCLP